MRRVEAERVAARQGSQVQRAGGGGDQAVAGRDHRNQLAEVRLTRRVDDVRRLEQARGTCGLTLPSAAGDHDLEFRRTEHRDQGLESCQTPFAGAAQRHRVEHEPEPVLGEAPQNSLRHRRGGCVQAGQAAQIVDRKGLRRAQGGRELKVQLGLVKRSAGAAHVHQLVAVEPVKPAVAGADAARDAGTDAKAREAAVGKHVHHRVRVQVAQLQDPGAVLQQCGDIQEFVNVRPGSHQVASVGSAREDDVAAGVVLLECRREWQGKRDVADVIGSAENETAPGHQTGNFLLEGARPAAGSPSRDAEAGPMGEPGLPRRVLVRMPNWVGDACLEIPFLVALRRQLPEARITALARSGPDEVATLAAVDEVILLDDRGPLWTRPRRLHEAGVRLRGHRFDAAVSLAETTSSAFLLRTTGIGRTVGYGRGLARLLLSTAVDLGTSSGLHRAAAYLRLLQGLGLEVPALTWEPPAVSEAAREAGAARLAPLGNGRPRIGLGVGSMAASRRWPIDSWVSLCHALRAGVVLLGGVADRAVADEIAAQVGPRVLNLAGQTRIVEIPGVLSHLDVMVSNDSGAAHLAALARLPTLCSLARAIRSARRRPGTAVRSSRIRSRARPA